MHACPYHRPRLLLLATVAQASAGAEIVMLDNMQPAELKEAARRLKEAHPHVTIEASGVSAWRL